MALYKNYHIVFFITSNIAAFGLSYTDLMKLWLTWPYFSLWTISWLPIYHFFVKTKPTAIQQMGKDGVVWYHAYSIPKTKLCVIE